MDPIIKQTMEFVKANMPVDPTGHDWHHAFRVWNTAKHIAIREGGNLLVIELGALLHDIADWKFNETDEHGVTVAKAFLSSINVDEETINNVCHIIKHISYKGLNSPEQQLSLEGYIVRDADRLDALGAIGIARTFAYGGYKKRPIHDPLIPPTIHNTFEEYKNSQGTTYNHFYEKLLHLKEKMHTATAKELAQKRHEFLETFLTYFKYEWAGSHN